MTSPEQALIARMWQRYAGVAAERVDLLEAFAAALASGSASTEQRRDARAAAHKLTGSLATYGRPGSTEARELERLLAEGDDLSAVPGLVVALREAVEVRP